jgi:hypothetical protein
MTTLGMRTITNWFLNFTFGVGGATIARGIFHAGKEILATGYDRFVRTADKSIKEIAYHRLRLYINSQMTSMPGLFDTSMKLIHDGFLIAIGWVKARCCTIVGVKEDYTFGRYAKNIAQSAATYGALGAIASHYTHDDDEYTGAKLGGLYGAARGFAPGTMDTLSTSARLALRVDPALFQQQYTLLNDQDAAAADAGEAASGLSAAASSLYNYATGSGT